jgi:hypothetical protein
MKFNVYITEPIATVEADNAEEALEIAKERVDELAGSNDGSEILAASDIRVEPKA